MWQRIETYLRGTHEQARSIAEPRRVAFHARLREAGQRGVQVRVYDISPRGLCCDTARILPPGGRVWIQLPTLGPLPARVRWCRRDLIGCAFERALHPAVYTYLIEQVPMLASRTSEPD